MSPISSDHDLPADLIKFATKRCHDPDNARTFSHHIPHLATLDHSSASRFGEFQKQRIKAATRQTIRASARFHSIEVRDEPLTAGRVNHHPFHLMWSCRANNLAHSKQIEQSDSFRVDVFRASFVSRKPRFVEEQHVVTRR
jgi:hypothetical protein